MQSCPACTATFTASVKEGTPITLVEESNLSPGEDPASLRVQQVTNVTGVPASVIPKWRHLKPVAIVAFLAPMGFLILIGLLLSGEVYKPEKNSQYFQPLTQNEKVRLTVAVGFVQITLFILLLSL